MIARTGSLGITEDLWKMLHYACYTGALAEGHRWEPPAEVREIVRWSDEALDTDWDRETTGTVPFSPSCKQCRRAARDCMRRRGIDERALIRLFDKVGARWDWVTAEKRAARQERDNGVCLPDPEGPGFVTDQTLRARRKRREDAIALADRMDGRQTMRVW